MTLLKKISISICGISLLLTGCSKNSVEDASLKNFISEKDFKLFPDSKLDLDASETFEFPKEKKITLLDLDRERLRFVQAVFLMIKIDSADVWTNNKFLYNADGNNGLSNLKTLFEMNDFKIHQPKNNICYSIVMARGKTNDKGEDNEFIVSSWGQQTSSKNPKKKGILIDGTLNGLPYTEDKRIESLGLSEADFNCASIAGTTKKILSAVGGNGIGLYVDKNGIQDAFNTKSKE